MKKEGYNIKKYEHSSQTTDQMHFLPQKGQPPCVCRLKDNIANQKLNQCPRCNQYLHCCLLPEKAGRDKEYIVGRCCYCIARLTDPSWQVVKVLNEAYFSIKDSRKMGYQITFKFQLELPIPEGHSVEARCFYAGDHQVTFPMLGTLYLNKQEVKVFKPLLYNSNMKRRKDDNLHLTGPFKQINQLQIRIPRIDQRKIQNEFKYQNRSPFFLSVFLTRYLDISRLEKKIIGSSFITRQQSCSKFFSTEIQAQKQILKCPYTLEFIKFPVRGELCTHFQVFCFQTFYSLSKGNSKWSCPICKKKTYIPVLDVWIRDILNEIRDLHIRDEDDIQVMFYRDGRYNHQLKKKDEEKEKQKQKQLIRLKKQQENPKKRRSNRLKQKKGSAPNAVQIDLKEQEAQDRFQKGKRPNEIVLDDLDQLVICQQIANKPNTEQQLAQIIDDESSWQDQLRELSENASEKSGKKASIQQPQVKKPTVVEAVVKTAPKPIQQFIQPPPVISTPPKRYITELNSKLEKQMSSLKIEKVATLQPIKCQNMHTSDLMKIFNPAGKNKSRRIKQLTDDFPNLFSNF